MATSQQERLAMDMACERMRESEHQMHERFRQVLQSQYIRDQQKYHAHDPQRRPSNQQSIASATKQTGNGGGGGGTESNRTSRTESFVIQETESMQSAMNGPRMRELTRAPWDEPSNNNNYNEETWDYTAAGKENTTPIISMDIKSSRRSSKRLSGYSMRRESLEPLHNLPLSAPMGLSHVNSQDPLKFANSSSESLPITPAEEIPTFTFGTPVVVTPERVAPSEPTLDMSPFENRLQSPVSSPPQLSSPILADSHSSAAKPRVIRRFLSKLNLSSTTARKDSNSSQVSASSLLSSSSKLSPGNEPLENMGISATLFQNAETKLADPIITSPSHNSENTALKPTTDLGELPAIPLSGSLRSFLHDFSESPSKQRTGGYI